MNEAPSKQPVNPLAKAQGKASRSLWISSISLIVAIIAILLGGFSWQQYAHMKDAAFASSMDSSSQQQTLSNTVEKLQTNLQATQQNVTQLMRSIGSTHQQTMLSQIAYLVNLANLQLNISHDVKSSLHLLKLAEAKLQALNDPRLFSLNKSITKDIVALQRVPKFNLTAIISKIDLLNEAVADASFTPNSKDLKQAASNANKAVNKADANKKDKWYKRFWHHVSGVKDLIIIRHTNNKLTPLLSAEQKVLIKSIIQSKLLLAEYAAIQHNNALFHKHLDTVKKWLGTYYFDSIDRQHLIAQIDALQDVNVNPAIPDMGDTIAVLNASLNALSEPSTIVRTPKIRRQIKTPKKSKATLPKSQTDDNPGVAA